MDSDEVCMKSNQNISLLISFVQINYLNQELTTFLWLVIFHVAVSVGSNYVLTVALCIGKKMAVFFKIENPFFFCYCSLFTHYVCPENLFCDEIFYTPQRLGYTCRKLNLKAINPPFVTLRVCKWQDLKYMLRLRHDLSSMVQV
jgi:hypothetical protein